MEYIRHLTESGDWSYSNVVTVGQLSLLNTTDKTDVVNSINEIHDRLITLNGSNNANSEIIGGLQGSVTQIVQDMILNNATYDEIISQVKQNINDANANIVGNKEVYDAFVKKVNADVVIINTAITTNKDELVGQITSVKDKADADILLANQEVGNLKLRASELESTTANLDTTVQQNLVNTDKKITDLSTEVGTKISKTTFDSAIGVNKWISTFYDKAIVDISVHPQLSDLLPLKPSHVDEIEDLTSLYPYTVAKSGYLHLYTNVNLATDKMVTFSLSHTNGASFIMNGAYIYYQAGIRVDQVFSASLKAGWNTIEIIVGVNKEIGRVQMTPTVSSSVTKMTTTIGVGNKDVSKLTQLSTELKQTDEKITLKADREILVNGVLTTAEAQLEVQADAIATKVTDKYYNTFTGQYESVGSLIEQYAESIKQIVKSTEFDSLNQVVKTQGTSIETLATGMTTKVEKTELNKVTGDLGLLTTQVSTLAGQVLTKVEESTFNTLSGTVDSHKTLIDANTRGITEKVSNTVFSGLEVKVNDIDSAVRDVGTTLDDLQNVTIVALLDGAINEAEKLAIQQMLVALEKESSDVLMQRERIVLNENLSADEKSLLDAELVKYNASYNALVQNINLLTLDSSMVIGATERAILDNLVEDYRLKLNSMKQTMLHLTGIIDDIRIAKLNSDIGNLETGLANTNVNITDKIKEVYSEVQKTSDGIKQSVGEVERITIQNKADADSRLSSLGKSIEGKANSSDIADLSKTIADTTTTITQAYTTALAQTKTDFNFSINETKKVVEGHSEVVTQIENNMNFSANGLEIGRTDSDMKVLISNSKMSFMDNAVEVAYIGGQKYYITNGEVTSSLVIGNHEFSKLGTGSTIIRWVGGQ